MTRENTGIAYTDDSVFKTDDNGVSWQTMGLPGSFTQIIGAVSFLDKNVGWSILIDSRKSVIELAKTNDGGNLWTIQPVDLQVEDLSEAELEDITLELSDPKNAQLILPLTSSSNFTRRAVYKTTDGGQNWRIKARAMNKNETDAETAFNRNNQKSFRSLLPEDENILASELRKNSAWLLTANGECANFKSNCVQTTKIYAVSENRALEITPPEIKESNRVELENIKTATENPLLLLPPPGGSTRISQNRGFDKCTAAPVDQMRTWWNASPFFDVNIYMSGRNRGCSQALLTSSWVNQVSGMGWGLIPTVVGYQAPCSACTTCQKHSSDPATAETQGRGEADIAINDAASLGLARGTILYYDMERYDDVSGTGACSTPVKSFLKGWTDRLKEQGFISGVYGSPFNAAGDWVNIPAASQMDVVWLARWNNVASVYGVAPLADSYWTNHQRIHQYIGGHNETWGGVTFNIDSDIEDAPVAGEAFPKARFFDFDGDAKADVSVYRSSEGNWYISNSGSAGALSVVRFGLAGDKIVPADYDGDGKTDIAVYRPENGIWFILKSSGGVQYTQFGTAEDVPQPADYNGDGKTEIAVFRPSTGVWFIFNDQNSQYTAVQFGSAEDKPVAADYNGDGKSEIAVYRPSQGLWFIYNSATAQYATTRFGVPTDKPVAADYDGDGKTDIAVYRPNEGNWYILGTKSGYTVTRFGLSSDLPIPADYDGDGKTDIAVYRPSEGNWYQLKSRDGFSTVKFGLDIDKPTPSAFVY